MPETAELNILIETAADFVLPYTVKDDDGKPLDLTGATVSAQLREFAEAADAFDFFCIHNGSGGRITITMPHETTSQIAFRQGVYDVRVVMADGTVSHPLSGEAYIKEEVTKPYDGAVLFMLGFETYDDLPKVGAANRIYFVYQTREYYRWNGMNYILTGMANISSIEKIKTELLVDTYRMNFESGRYFDYEITNGRGINSIEKVGSSGGQDEGKVDTYRINFNDETEWEYQVTNGRTLFATFDVDLNTGALMMRTPDWYEQPVFSINEDGELIMRID